MTDPEVVAELQRIANDNGGLLTAEAVVQAAASTRSILHSKFEWDDTEAARKYRLDQARQLIRVTVTYIDREHTTPMRVFVSLSSDRYVGNGGYRLTTNVLSDAQYRKQLLEDALADMQRYEQKYSHLRELASIFSAYRKVKAKQEGRGISPRPVKR